MYHVWHIQNFHFEHWQGTVELQVGDSVQIAHPLYELSAFYYCPQTSTNNFVIQHILSTSYNCCQLVGGVVFITSSFCLKQAYSIFVPISLFGSMEYWDPVVV